TGFIGTERTRFRSRSAASPLRIPLRAVKLVIGVIPARRDRDRGFEQKVDVAKRAKIRQSALVNAGLQRLKGGHAANRRPFGGAVNAAEGNARSTRLMATSF